MNPGAHAIAALSGEPGIASVPAPRASPPDCSPVAVSRLVTGLSRASCRDASGLAVLMSTGRRAGLPGLSRPAVPAPRWPGSCASPARAARSASSPTASCSGGLPGIANTGGWASQGTSHARGNGQPPSRWARVAHRAAWSDARPVPGAAANAPEWASGYVPVVRPRRQPGRWMLQDCPRPPGRLPPGDLDSVSGWARLYYRHAAELFETATRGMRGGRRTVRR